MKTTSRNSRRTLMLLVLIIIIVAFGSWLLFSKVEAPSGPAEEGTTETVNFDKSQLSIDSPASLWLVVNKHRQLSPATYIPDDLVTPKVPLRSSGEEMLLRQEPASAVEAMFTDVKNDGLELMLASGYRSYNYQRGLYDRYVREQGQAVADTQSARPGYSEHQTGLAADIEPVSMKCEIEACFADTPEGKWLAANAYKYGFVIRYAKDKTPITGYTYEPWHLRYVGKDLAAEMHRQKINTLEEFFDLPAAPDYN